MIMVGLGAVAAFTVTVKAVLMALPTSPASVR